jgi:hypothetical protein
LHRDGELRKPRPPNPKGSQLIEMMNKMGKLNVSDAAASSEAKKL